MRSRRKVCKKWWDIFWMQTITQISTKSYLLLFDPFAMVLEICIQNHSMVFALNWQINKQKYVKTINLLCAGNKVFVKNQSQGGGFNHPLAYALVATQHLCFVRNAINLLFFPVIVGNVFESNYNAKILLFGTASISDNETSRSKSRVVQVTLFSTGISKPFVQGPHELTQNMSRAGRLT